MPDPIRLQVYLAKCGIASRRKCEEIIAQGRVSVNGKVVMTPGTKVTEEDTVTYDGRKIRQAKQKIYVALHKPTKFLCSTTDPDDRPLAIDLISPSINHRLFYVGRLDYLTSGLIFFTNDGDFAKKMTHPSTHIEKEYVVTTKDEIPLELMEEFKKGIYVQGERFKMKDFEFKGNRCVHIILEEGKNRELRKVFLSRNISVKKVHRVRIGSVLLKGINSGHFRRLTEKEVKSLLKAADAKGEGFEANRAKKKSISHIKTVERQTEALNKEREKVKSPTDDEDKFSHTSRGKKDFSSNRSASNDVKKSSGKRSYTDSNTTEGNGRRKFSDNKAGNRDFKKTSGKRSYSNNGSSDRYSKKSSGKRSYTDGNSSERDFKKNGSSLNKRNSSNRGSKKTNFNDRGRR